jgi:uracil-DNA glycosylase family 4
MTPDASCRLCPRLAAYRDENAAREPTWHNAPVPSFGAPDAALLVIGQAPGVNGANRTGRPFTGDYAGVLLYETLLKFGFASGRYEERPDDGLTLHNCRITNAVRCAPPQHKVETSDKNNCNPFLRTELADMPNLRAILTLGGIAHAMSLRALGLKATAHRFAHGAQHTLKPGLRLFNSYHVSRYNTSTKRLNTEMFEKVVGDIKAYLKP